MSKKRSTHNIHWLISALTFCVYIFPVSGQQLEKIWQTDISKGLQLVKPYIDKKVNDSVRFVGLGDVQELLKESARLNSAIAAYLIQEKGFNTFVVNQPDWVIRGMNAYMIDPDKKPLSQPHFDSLFTSAFGNSPRDTRDFKDFLLWLKHYNLTQESNKVSIRGGGFLIDYAMRYPEMNHYFIETYIRPYNNQIADSMAYKWESIGNSNSFGSDSVVIAYMQQWEKAVIGHKLFGGELFAQMKNDIEQRAVALAIKTSTISTGEKFHRAAEVSGLIEARLIDDLLQIKTNKIIIASLNVSFTDSDLYAYNTDKKAVRLPTNGSAYRKFFGRKYINTVITFADSANVLAIKNDTSFQRVVMYGDSLAKKLLTQKEVYYFPEDKAALSNFSIPVIYTGYLGKDINLFLDTKNNAYPFDILFILPSLTRSEYLNSFFIK